MTVGENEDDSHGGWVARDTELDELATAMLDQTREAAQELADEHGVALRVCDRRGVAYTKSYRFGRITVDSYDGIVPRAQRGQRALPLYVRGSSTRRSRASNASGESELSTTEVADVTLPSGDGGARRHESLPERVSVTGRAVALGRGQGVRSVSVSVRSRWWVPTAAFAMLPVLMALILTVPESEREGSNGEVLLVILATAVASALFLGALYYFRGSDSFTADDEGLRTQSRKHGNRTLAWSEVVELGWVVPGRYAPGGLAGRLRNGGRYEPGGPNIATWLAQPTGRMAPREELDRLRAFCARHGVAWRDYASAEVL
jgi:hypothetical protein